MRRGFTLIELMIVVACLSIAIITAGGMATSMRTAALEPVQRERALQVLEHEAGAVLAGGEASAGERQRLLAELPDGKLSRRADGDVVRLTVDWKAPSGRRASRELVLLRGRR
jgi:prepilin-type N-terminal cleavage/methylation domain-containing protein